MTLAARRVYDFGPFRLDPAERRLWRDGAAVPVTPKVFDLLVVLVERRGRLVEKDALLKALWPDSFVEEANLTVNISTLRRVLAEPDQGVEYIETIPRRGYRFVGAVTERDVQDENGAGAGPVPGLSPLRQRQRWVLAAAALLVLGLSAGWARWTSTGTEVRRVGAAASIRTIAILPFLPLGEQADADSLGLGMADALITKLTNVRQISVRPTSSVVRYSTSGRDPLAAGRDLAVDGVLEGHIQRAGASIRVSVQLLSVPEGVPLWADQFDASQTTVFEVQDSISERITTALSLTLSDPERRLLTKRLTSNTAAYEAFQIGRFLQLRGAPGGASTAIDHFRAAIAQDPNFAAAQAALATALVTTAGDGRPGDYTEAAAHAADALRLDPDLPDAHLAAGWVAMYGEWDWAEAERRFRRAVALGPAVAMGHLALSTVLTATQVHDEAVAEMTLANQLEPTSSLVVRDLAWTLFQARRFEVSERWSRRAAEMDAADGRAPRDVARALLRQGKVAAAADALRAAHRLGVNVAVEVALVKAAGGPEDPALTGVSAPPQAFERARFHAVRGERDLAFEALDRAAAERSARIVWLATEPDLDALRTDPRYLAMLRRVRLDVAGAAASRR